MTFHRRPEDRRLREWKVTRKASGDQISFIDEQWSGDIHHQGNTHVHGQCSQLSELDGKAQRTRGVPEKVERPLEGGLVSRRSEVRMSAQAKLGVLFSCCVLYLMSLWR